MTHLHITFSIAVSKINPEDIATWYVNGKKRKVCLVEVSKEVYEAYVNSDEAAKKQKQRIKQKAERKGAEYNLPVSLDALKENNDFDIADTSNIMDMILLKMLVQDAMEHVRKKNPLWAAILNLVSLDYSEREIAKVLHQSRGSIRNYKSQAFDLMKKLLKDYI